MTGVLVWITGLAGAGKTTIGTRLAQRLRDRGDVVVYLDGDTMRGIVGPTLGHARDDRRQLCRRYSNLCKLLTDQGINVVCATMCLLSEVHEWNRAEQPHYVEVLVDCSLEELKRRDQKGLYTQAAKGETDQVMGAGQAYDLPKNSHLVIDNTRVADLDKKVDAIVDVLRARGYLESDRREGRAS